MKKNLFFAAIVAMTFASCANDDLLVENPTTPTEGSEVEIGFDTYAEGQTRATENNDKSYAWQLSAHHETFAVWSTKLVAGTYVPVHGDGKVTANTEGAGEVVTWTDTNSDNTKDTWKPAHRKFWDKAATSYRFFAAAPSTSNWVINNGSSKTNYEEAYFTLNGFTLAGTNITELTSDGGYTEVMNGTTENGYKKSWLNKGDIDLMIAAPCEIKNISSITSANQTVNLQFIHILSRLNVAFKKSTALNDATVKVINCNVVNLVKGGNFDETNTAAANGSAMNCHWTPLENTSADNLMTITGKIATKADEALLSTKSYYTVQSLVIPQDVTFEPLKRNGTDKTTTSKPYVYVKYTIDNEPYEAYINLADAFGKSKYQEKTGLTADTDAVDAYYTRSGAGTTASPYVYTPAYGKAQSGVTYYEKVADGVLAFNEGWQNNLTLTLDALEILFDATTSEWADADPAGSVKVD